MKLIEVRWFDCDGHEFRRDLFPHEGETEEMCQGWQEHFNSLSWEAYSQGEGDLTTIEVVLRDLSDIMSDKSRLLSLINAGF